MTDLKDKKENLNLKRMWLLLVATIIISAGVLFSDSARDDDFSRYDSTYYSTISQNILSTGNWLEPPDTGGTTYSQHPPLIFWATALSLKLFGESVFSAVLFSLLCGVGTCVAIFFIGTVLKNDIVGFFSGMGLLLTRYMPRVARHNTMEVPLMFFITLAILFLILGSKKHKSFYLLFGVSTGFAVLTKGVIGLFPLLMAILVFATNKKLKDLWNPFFLGGIVLFLAVPGTWLFMKSDMASVGILDTLRSYNNFVRGAFKGLSRVDPGTRMRFITRLIEFCYIIIPGVILGIYFIVRDNIKEKRRDLLVIPVWALIFLAAFLISNWRRGLFLLPMYPALAVMFGVGAYGIIPKKYSMYTVCLLAAFFAGNIVAPLLFPHWEPKSVQEVVFKDTYLPKAKKALKALYAQAPQGMKFVLYRQPDESQARFFFSSDYRLEVCKSPEDLKELVNSPDPVLFYITKGDFSKVDRDLHKKLKAVYTFDKQVFATNKMDLVPVFDIAE